MTHPVESAVIAAVLVVPCYNEANRLDSPAIGEFLGARASFGLLLVDDSSTDRTLSVLLPDLALCTTASRAEAVGTDIPDTDGVVSR